MMVPYQNWWEIDLFYNSLQIKEWKGMKKKTYSSWMVKCLKNIKEHSVPLHSLGHQSHTCFIFLKHLIADRLKTLAEKKKKFFF